MTFKGSVLHGNVLYGSAACIADQTDMICTCVRTGQSGDGVAVAVKLACKRIAFCADGRPLGAVHSETRHQAGVDGGLTFVAYLVGKPAQLPLVGNLVIVTFCWRCLFTFTAVGANAVIIVVVTAVIWLIGITLAVGLRAVL